MRTRPGAMVALGLALAAAACTDDAAPPVPPECNGSLALCARRYDQVAYPTTHNAMSNAEDGFSFPNQHRAVARQLADGVRGLMLDVYVGDNGRPYLCHAICSGGQTLLVDGLATIRGFLDQHRGEVVTIIFESYIPAPMMADAFAASGLDRYVHAQAPGAPWPTLRELIDREERLVVFTDDDGGGAYPWYLDVWAHAWETPFAAATTADFTCAMGRGDAAHPLFIFNHFLTRTFAVPEEAATVNANPFLLDRARACMTASGRLPNFVTIDFYDQGDLFAAVAALNE